MGFVLTKLPTVAHILWTCNGISVRHPHLDNAVCVAGKATPGSAHEKFRTYVTGPLLSGRPESAFTYWVCRLDTTIRMVQLYVVNTGTVTRHVCPPLPLVPFSY